MSARITKAEVAFLLPLPASPLDERLSALREAAARAQHDALLARLRAALAWLAGLPARAQARAELRDMSAHELADLGLTRGEIDAAVRGLPR